MPSRSDLSFFYTVLLLFCCNLEGFRLMHVELLTFDNLIFGLFRSAIFCLVEQLSPSSVEPAKRRWFMEVMSLVAGALVLARTHRPLRRTQVRESMLFRRKRRKLMFGLNAVEGYKFDGRCLRASRLSTAAAACETSRMSGRRATPSVYMYPY